MGIGDPRQRQSALVSAAFPKKLGNTPSAISAKLHSFLREHGFNRDNAEQPRSRETNESPDRKIAHIANTREFSTSK
jgi:hypothetical protein